jgi:hypothetical protein
MKKIFILMLSVVALVAFTSSAFALHADDDMFEYTPSIVKSKKAQLDVSGHIRARGEAANNGTTFRDSGDNPYKDTTDRKASYDARVNLMIQATVSERTKGVIELQSQKHGDDNGGTSDSYGWGSCTGAKGTYRNGGNCKPADVSFRQAYIAHQWKGLLSDRLTGFKVGHMPIALGNGMFYNHAEFGDDAIIFWMQPADNTEISFGIIKPWEGNGGTADDIDIYAFTYDTVWDGFTFGADLSYLKDKSTDGGSPSIGNLGEGAELFTLGLRGDTTVGSVKLSADLAVQTGTITEYTPSGDDVDMGGYAIEIKASTTVGSVGIHGGFGYGSGDDKDDDDFDGFITSLGNGQDYTYLYDQKTVTAAQTITNTGGNSVYTPTGRTGLSNTMYVNVGASTNVNPDVKVSGDIYYLRAAEEVADDVKTAGCNVTSTCSDASKDIGVELDGKITYQLDTNLVWYVEAGYLIAGDFYKNVTQDDDDPDDAYSVRHGVVLTF